MAKKIYTKTVEIKPIPQVMIFARHKLEEVARISPGPGGRSWTKIEDIREALEKNGYWPGRKDIALVNLWAGPTPLNGENLEQFCVEPNGDGEPYWNGAEDWLSEEEMNEVREEIKRCVAAEKEYGLPPRTLT